MILFALGFIALALGAANMWVDQDNRHIVPPRLWPVLAGIAGCALIVAAF